MKKRFFLSGAILCLLLLCSGLASAYDYPFKDPYVATVLGTPDEYMAKLPKKVPLKHDSINMFPDRKVPGALWNFTEANNADTCSVFQLACRRLKTQVERFFF